MTDLLFVYGTLLRALGHPMHGLLARHSTFLGNASMQGRLYEVAGYPGAIASRHPQEHVLGELYRLRDEDVLARLDDYEECSDRFPAPHEYVRERVTVRLQDGNSRIAWTYRYNRNVATLPRIPGGDYLAYRQTAETP